MSEIFERITQNLSSARSRKYDIFHLNYFSENIITISDFSTFFLQFTNMIIKRLYKNGSNKLPDQEVDGQHFDDRNVQPHEEE